MKNSQQKIALENKNQQPTILYKNKGNLKLTLRRNHYKPLTHTKLKSTQQNSHAFLMLPV